MHVPNAGKAVWLLLLLFVAALCFGETNPSIAAASGAASSTNAKIAEGYGKLPLSFEANRGQTDSRVRFVSRGQGYSLFLTSREAVLTLARPAARQSRLDKRSKAATTKESQATPSTVVSLQLEGANRKPVITQEDELPAKSNYFIGNDPAKWRTNIANYGRVRYHEIYPGIDLVYYGNQRQLEHDFVVAPGADPSLIKLRLRGVHNLRIDEGNLVMSTAQGELRLLKPEIYQEVNGAHRQVSGRYVLKGGNEVGFATAKFDRSRPLVIDPVLSYSTYLGGSNWDHGYAIAVDGSGNAYVAGDTFSSNFPTLNPIEGSLHGPDYGDAFVAKLSANGTLLYSTYLGGGNSDIAYGIAVDSSGNAYITGQTTSFDFPTVNAYQSSRNGSNTDAFVAKLNATGSALVYSTYFGGSNIDVGNCIAVDSSGNAYVAGGTWSTDFPLINPAYSTFLGLGYQYHVFVAKFNTSGTPVYSTYLGGDEYEAAYGIDVDNAGNIYVTGVTESDNFPTTSGAFQTSQGFIFVTKLKPDGSLPVYSTYLGSGPNDGDGSARGIAVDRASGKAYITGYVIAYDDAATLPISANAFQKTIKGGEFTFSAFVAALTADGSDLLYCTYLGGSQFPMASNGDQANAIALDSAGNAYITGFAYSTDFPTLNAIQSSNANTSKGPNAFITELNTTGSALIYSTYLGGSGAFAQGDQGNGIAVDSAGNAYIVGQTNSTDFPTANAYQSSYGGGNFDAFVAKIGTGVLTPVLSVSPSTLTFTATVGGSNPAGQPITITNTGSGTLNWNASYTSTWLSLDSSGGTAPSTLHSYVNTTGMAAGTYKDTITITAGGASGSPATVAVTLTVADFTLSADTGSLDLPRGQNGTVHLTVTPLSGFNQTVSFACSGLPSGASCSFSPSTVTPQGSAVTSTLTVGAGTVAEHRRDRHLPWTATSVMLAICSLGFGMRRSPKLIALLLLLLAVTAGTLLIGCGGGFNGTTPASTVLATPTTTNVTVTATAGTLQHQVTFALTIH